MAAGLVLAGVCGTEAAQPQMVAREVGARADVELLPGAGDYVVVVHGLSWYRDGIRPAAEFFHQQGYSVVTLHYRSRQIGGIQEAVDALRRAVSIGCVDPARRVHFVGHSMGGIVIRRLLGGWRPPGLGGVVVMGSPNQGTPLADAVRDSWLERVFGTAVAELGTEAATAAREPDYPLGVIMGGRSMFPFLSPFVPGRDDGVVAVASGRVEGMADFLVLPTTHTHLPRSGRALRAAEAFFRQGKFQRADGSASLRPGSGEDRRGMRQDRAAAASGGIKDEEALAAHKEQVSGVGAPGGGGALRQRLKSRTSQPVDGDPRPAG